MRKLLSFDTPQPVIDYNKVIQVCNQHDNCSCCPLDFVCAGNSAVSSCLFSEVSDDE